MKAWTVWMFGAVIVTLLIVIVVLLLQMGSYRPSATKNLDGSARITTAATSTTKVSVATTPTRVAATATNEPLPTATTTPKAATTINPQATTSLPSVVTTTTEPVSAATTIRSQATTSVASVVTTTTEPASKVLTARSSALDASPAAQQLFCDDIQAAIAAIILSEIGIEAAIPCYGYLDFVEEMICPNLDDESSIEAMVAVLIMLVGSEIEWPEGMEPTEEQIESLIETWVHAASHYLCPTIN